jgi:hypothetical protein
MQLELNEDERDALQHLLDGSLRELKGEIHDTDNVSFRRDLARYRDHLESISVRLAG